MIIPDQPRKKNTFVSYRVHDSSDETGRLVENLEQVFEESQISHDIKKLEPGVDFTVALAKSLESCDVLLAVIGPNWVGPADKDGITRIQQPNDWVRVDLETGFKEEHKADSCFNRRCHNAPTQDELPESLYPLLNRQTVELLPKRWKYNTDKLIVFLKDVVCVQPKQSSVVSQDTKNEPTPTIKSNSNT